MKNVLIMPYVDTYSLMHFLWARTQRARTYK